MAPEGPPEGSAAPATTPETGAVITPETTVGTPEVSHAEKAVIDAALEVVEAAAEPPVEGTVPSAEASDAAKIAAEIIASTPGEGTADATSTVPEAPTAATAPGPVIRRRTPSPAPVTTGATPPTPPVQPRAPIPAPTPRPTPPAAARTPGTSPATAPRTRAPRRTPVVPARTPGASPATAPSTPLRTPAAVPVPVPEARPEPLVPDTIDRETLDRGARFLNEFLYKKTSANAAIKNLESRSVTGILDPNPTPEIRRLLSHAANAEKARGDFLDMEKKAAKQKNHKDKAYFTTEAKKAKLELENRLDEMKVAYLKQWVVDNQKRNPTLTKEQINDMAIEHSAQTVFRAATDFYPSLEIARSDAIAQTPREKGLLQRYGEWSKGLPTWKRMILSAGIAAGTTTALMTAFGTMGIPMIAGIAGSRALRSAIGAGFAGSFVGGVEHFLGDTLDKRGKAKKKALKAGIQRDKDALTDVKVIEFETQLRAELAGKENWLEDRAIALNAMRKVDADAELFSKERSAIFGAREKKAEAVGTHWRKRLAIGTGLAVGGGMAVSAIDWHNIPEWIGGSGGPAVVGGGGGGPSVLERVRCVVIDSGGSGVPPGPELPDPLPICDPTEANVLTIAKGDTVWGMGRKFIGETVQGADGPTKFTKAAWAEAWKNSHVEMITESGKHIQVPISEVDLVHAGDQVAVAHENGKWVFQVGDYAKDNFKVGNTGALREVYEQNGFDIPKWLERSPLPPATLTESSAHVVYEMDGVLTASGTSSIESAGLAPQLYSNEGIDELTRNFTNATLCEQERALTSLGDQISSLSADMQNVGYSEQTLTQMASYHHELVNLQSSLLNAPEYLSHAAGLTTILEAQNVAPEFFDQVADMRVDEFIEMSNEIPAGLDKSGIEGVFRVYYQDADRMTDMLEDLSLGKRELRMSVGDFFKTHLDEFNMASPQ